MLFKWVAIVIFGFGLCAQAFEPRVCAELFAKDARALNPTAAQSSASYSFPNNRKWRDYVRVLFRGFDDARSAILERDLVIDLGGGQGRAMADLAQTRAVKAVVVNTQNFSDAYVVDAPGSLSYRVGWAEEVLPTFEKNSAGAVFDLFGAFHYSVHKDRLLEETYRVLKPGRSSYFLFDFENAVAMVGTVRLDRYLLTKYPKIFSARYTSLNGRTVCVLKMTKRRFEWRSLSLKLDIATADMNPAKPNFPRVLFRERR